MTAQLAPQPKFRAFTTAGLPLVGGLLYTYAAGTTTPLATYTDRAAASPNANPIVLDANGECDLRLSNGVAYKIIAKNAAGATQWTVDNWYGAEESGAAASIYTDFASTSNVALGDALVGVKQPFTGAVATTAHEVNSRVYSLFDALTAAERADVVAFTGSVDVTTTCQTMLTWLGANGGGTVHAPAGKYKISGSGLTIPSGVFLKGSSGGSPGVNAGTQFVAASAAVTQLILIDALDCGLSDVMLYGEATNAVIGVRIGLNGVASDSPGRIRLEGVTAQECKWGFHVLNGAFLLQFKNCVAWNGKKGWYFDNTTASTYGGTTIIQRGGNIVKLENCHTVSNSEHGIYGVVVNCLEVTDTGFDSDAIGIEFSVSSGSITHCTSDNSTTASIVLGGSKVLIEDVVFLSSQLPISIQNSFGPSFVDVVRCKSTLTVGSYGISPAVESRLFTKENLFDKPTQNDGERFNHDYRIENGYSSVTASGTPSSLSKAITFSRPFLLLKGISIVPESQYTNRIDTLLSGPSASGVTANFHRDDATTWNNGETQTFYWSATGVDHPLSIFEGSTATNVLTLTTTASGYFALGQTLVGTGIAVGTTISTLASGSLGVAGSTYTLSTSPGTIASATLMTA